MSLLRFDPSFGRPAAGKLHVGSGWWQPRGERRHGALDIGLAEGTPVWAIERGVVVRAQATASGDAGIWCALRHDGAGGLVSRYMHLSRLDVELGATVARGAVLGLSGDTGHSTAPHLHLDLKVPAALLASVRAVVGKPSTGWLPEQEPYGHGIPAEPWIPVDSYRADTIDDAKRYGIPLWRARQATRLRTLALAGAAAGGVAVMWRRLGWH